MDVIHPIIYKGITLIPHTFGVIVLSLLMAIFAADCAITVSTILKFNRRLKLMDDVAAQIHKLSDEIGENIFENVTGVVEKSEEFQENHAELIEKIADTGEEIKGRAEAKKRGRTVYLEEKKREYAELTEKYQQLMREKSFGFKRLVKAFPDMTSRTANETLQKYKNYFNKKKTDEKE